ncbi:MAG: glycosyltransferase family 2 protein [Prevotella sp.]|jgi:hypothetical protein|nr:glycosyltransferase family 2 protein [Prevotella sp.]
MKINCFIPFQSIEQVEKTVCSLNRLDFVADIFLLSPTDVPAKIDGCKVLVVDSIYSTAAVQAIAAQATADYALIYAKAAELSFGYFALERMLQVAVMSGAGMVYSDRYRLKDGEKTAAPLITYQKGSLRDDFDFGAVMLYRTNELKKAASEMDADYRHAGLYDLRLKVSQSSELVHINEYLYTEIENDTRKSAEKQFDYVNPRNRDIQIEMEHACTNHLRKIGAYLKPDFKQVDFSQQAFEYEASVIIPVRNRARTIADAIRSAINQKTDFRYNVIVIDNYSTDGTTEIIRDLASDERLIHLIPEDRDLGIGGCWNEGVAHPKCGKFAVQLDSDDLYSDEQTLQKIVDAFYAQNCAMLVGTYLLTDFNRQTLPPGIIDHREWTPENGRNNALRINGLGAPRAFYTPLLRRIKLPNTSYGEDYALGLAFSREYQIGRIYDVLYLCRRWEDNSDAAPDALKINAHNTYKDRLRTWEIEARTALNTNSLMRL